MEILNQQVRSDASAILPPRMNPKLASPRHTASANPRGGVSRYNLSATAVAARVER